MHGSTVLKTLRTPSRRISTCVTLFAAAKTVKSYGDLPTGLLRPDGTRAAPLEEWWGGPDNAGSVLSEKLRSHKKESYAVLPLDIPRTCPGIDDPQVSPLPKRARKSRASKQSNTEAAPANSIAERDTPALASDKPKRKRKSRKLSEGIIESQECPHEASVTPEPEKNGQRNINETNFVEETPPAVPQGLLAQDILGNLEKFPHCILLTRVGQFYESYFDQAIEVARLLGIKLTSRKWAGRRIHMCGFPLAHLDKHLKTLVQQENRFVAMCEEFPTYPGTAIKSFTRRVTRVITPGTLIDEPFLNPYENNYLLAIGVPNPTEEASQGDLGLAWIDVSTGEFFSKTSCLENLQDELARIGPREVVLDMSLRSQPPPPIMRALAEDNYFVSYATPSMTERLSLGNLKLTTEELPSESDLVSVPSVTESAAIALLTEYLHKNLMEHMPTLSNPNREGLQSRMQIDSHTIKALEIRENYREGGTKGSLLSSIKRTITTGGTRLLARWLCSPSTSISEINARQSLVALLFNRPHLKDDIAVALEDLEDISRVVQKFVLGRGSIGDLQVIRKATQMWSQIFRRIKQEKEYESLGYPLPDEQAWASMDALTSRVMDLQALSTRIESAIDDQDPSSIDPEEVVDTEVLNAETTRSSNGTELGTFWRYGFTKWSIKPTFSPDLVRLHKELQILLKSKDEMELRLQLTYDAPSLTLRASPAQGMHVHLAKGKRDQSKLLVADEFVSIAESGSTRCFFYKEWSLLAGRIADTTLALTVAEKDAFETLRNEINAHAPYLRRNAEILAEIDVALGFATLATEMKFVRPVLTESPEYKVANGRHPTVELGLLRNGRVFTPNSINLTSNSMVHIITGPNMAGKSTYLRQTALTAILAQTGCFVPADSAELGIVDKLFSRIGAKDDLFHDRSTFMVEMLETADILRRATPRSLVIMDEVGRGTTVTDGLAIAYATVHHLVTANKCRSLFATHFHELADMLGYPHDHKDGLFSSVDFFCTDVAELADDCFAYQYRIKSGVNRDSHGLKVAQLAGMPPTAMQVAKETLATLRSQTS